MGHTPSLGRLDSCGLLSLGVSFEMYLDLAVGVYNAFNNSKLISKTLSFSKEGVTLATGYLGSLERQSEWKQGSPH